MTTLAVVAFCAVMFHVNRMVFLFPVGVSPGLDARPWFIGFGLLSVAIATLLLIYVRDFTQGLVERVTYHNDENGFCILRIKCIGIGGEAIPGN